MLRHVETADTVVSVSSGELASVVVLRNVSPKVGAVALSLLSPAGRDQLDADGMSVSAVRLVQYQSTLSRS
jgi:hypothetical protein